MYVCVLMANGRAVRLSFQPLAVQGFIGLWLEEA